MKIVSNVRRLPLIRQGFCDALACSNNALVYWYTRNVAPYLDFGQLILPQRMAGLRSGMLHLYNRAEKGTKRPFCGLYARFCSVVEGCQSAAKFDRNLVGRGWGIRPSPRMGRASWSSVFPRGANGLEPGIGPSRVGSRPG